MLHAILDDTQKRKRGKRMDAVCKLFLHAEKVYAKGHTIAGCVLVYRGVVIPYAVRLWANQTFCAGPQKLARGEPRRQFRKLTHLAADMINEVSLPSPGKVIVLFDSYYLCPAVTSACEAKRFPFIGVAKKNRNFYPQNQLRDKRKLSRYGANLLQPCRPQPDRRRQEASLGGTRGTTVPRRPRETGVQPPAWREFLGRHCYQCNAAGA